jgi:hypothetical protein
MRRRERMEDEGGKGGDLHEMCGLGEELCVDGETAVEGIAGRRDQAHGELALEHEHGTPAQGRRVSAT